MSIQTDVSIDNDDTTQYRCPFCETIYADERLARIHITRSDDGAHRTHNGLMPETPIEIITSEGDVIDEIHRQPDEIDVNALTPEDFPDEFDERKRRVLLVAAYNPHEGTFTELHERSSAVLEAHDLDPVSYNTVRQWIHEFYTPQQREDNESTEENNTPEADDDRQTEQTTKPLSDFTPKQQAVIITRLADPAASHQDIADRVGCSRSYPYQVFKGADDLIEELTAELESDTTLEDLLDDRLDAADREQLQEEGYLDDLDLIKSDSEQDEEVDSDAALLDGPITSETNVMSASPTNHLLADDIDTADLQSPEPVANGDGNQPSPESEIASDNAEPSEATGTTEREDAPDTQTEDEEDPTSAIDEEDGETVESVRKSDLEQLKAHIEFMRRVCEREAEATTGSNDRVQTQLAIISEVETELEQLLTN